MPSNVGIMSGASFGVGIRTLTSSVDATASTSITSASISPVNNSLLVVVGHCNQNEGSTIAVTSTTLSNVGAWTPVRVFSGANNTGTLLISYAQITGSAGSGTVTVGWTSSRTNRSVEVLEVTGYNTATPVLQSALGPTGLSSGTTYSLTLSSTPAATSVVLGALTHFGSTNVIPGTSFTELNDYLAGAVQMESQYRLLNATTTVDWSGLTNTSTRVGVAIEIATN